MADPYLGEIKILGFNFAPRGYALCNGQILSIAQNQALFALLGTTYGGDGRVTFALPDLRNRAPVHEGMGHALGEVGGTAGHTLTPAETAHTHTMKATINQASSNDPAGNVLAAKKRGGKDIYHSTQTGALHPSSLTLQGGAGQPHDNQQPYLGVNFVIAIVGIFPSRN
jgi:microcystin-dependent protein